MERVKAKDQSWQDLQEYITNKGAAKYIQILKRSDDADFVRHYTKLIEFFKPKLQKIDQTMNVSDKITMTLTPAEPKLRKLG